MYEAYFGFSQRPFTAAPLANRYFPAASVDAARQMLARCIERGAGAGVLIGPPGTGKSLLLQVLAGQFADKLAAVQLAGGQLESRRALLQAILFELRLPYRGLEEGELRLALVDHLTRGDKCPQGMLLLVDEAQTLPTLLLEELRMMTNLARGGETRVRLVLAGSMELEELLAGPDLQAFAQRLAARCYLEPFDRAETIDYLRFQVAVAGGQAERVFDAGALDAVYRATEGIPRLVNQLCDHALLLAYQAERRPLDAKAIDIAWADLQQLPSPWQHEHAADGEAGGSRDIIEFGALEDDEPAPAQATAWPAANTTVGAAGARASEPSEERVEMDFSADWPADEPDASEETSRARPRTRGPTSDSPGLSRTAAKAKAKGLRIVEDLDKLQVVVDPYDLDDEDDGEGDEADAAYEGNEPLSDAADSAAGDDVESAGRAAGVELAAANAGGHPPPNVWEDVVIPAEPPGCSAAPLPGEAAVPFVSRHAPHRAAPVYPGMAASRAPAMPARASVAPRPISSSSSFAAHAPEPVRSLEEEIVADRYAELDARQPPPRESAQPAPPEAPEDGAFTEADLGDDLRLDERVTLSEAIRLGREAAAAAAVARAVAPSPDDELRLAIDSVPPLPSPEDWLTDSATMVLDPTQMPPGMVAGASGRDLGSDIVVIEEEAPTAVPTVTEPLHRAERKDYKSLFAQLRRG
jgi:type II secretory pathway predicted ATPase ExeA